MRRSWWHLTQGQVPGLIRTHPWKAEQKANAQRAGELGRSPQYPGPVAWAEGPWDPAALSPQAPWGPLMPSLWASLDRVPWGAQGWFQAAGCPCL